MYILAFFFNNSGSSELGGTLRWSYTWKFPLSRCSFNAMLLRTYSILKIWSILEAFLQILNLCWFDLVQDEVPFSGSKSSGPCRLRCRASGLIPTLIEDLFRSFCNIRCVFDNFYFVYHSFVKDTGVVFDCKGFRTFVSKEYNRCNDFHKKYDKLPNFISLDDKIFFIEHEDCPPDFILDYEDYSCGLVLDYENSPRDFKELELWLCGFYPKASLLLLISPLLRRFKVPVC
jgi:hypothetical protein